VEIAETIPSGLPFVVRPRAWRTVALYEGIVVPFLPVPLLLLAIGVVVEDSFVVAMGVAVVLGMVATAALVSLGRWRLTVYRGVVLAAGPEGLWVRVRPYSSEGLWLSWSEVRQVEVAGPGRLGELRVHPARAYPLHGPRPYLFPLIGTDRSGPEIAQQLERFSAGRVPITVVPLDRFPRLGGWRGDVHSYSG
jgi:hypothetical protein